MDFVVGGVRRHFGAGSRGWWASRRSDLSPTSVLWLWWCAGILAHYDDRMHWDVAPVITASVAVSAVGMLLARSPGCMLAVGALQLGALWRLMPSVDNHWFFAGVVNLALITATLVWIVRRRGRGPLDRDWYEIAAPLVRWLVLAMYAFAVFHKLNTGFLDPDTSCAVHFYERLGRTPWVPALPGDLSDVHRHGIVGAVLATEAAIPLLLFGRRTWFLGIAVGVAFHLSTGAFMRHFPSLMFALYWVLVPTDVQRRWLDTVQRWIGRSTGGRLGFVGLTIVHAVGLSLASVAVHEFLTQAGMSRRAADSPYYWVLRVWNATTIIAAVVGVVAFVRISGAQPHPPGRLAVRPRWMVGLLLGFALNCMSPYLGLKTATSVAMWSNLTVTGGVSNHLFIGPGALQVFDFSSDVVRVRASNDKKLAKRARSKDRVPWITFLKEVRSAARRAKKKGKKLYVRYERAGEHVAVRDAAHNAVLMTPHPRWIRKWVRVKAARGDLVDRCTW